MGQEQGKVDQSLPLDQGEYWRMLGMTIVQSRKGEAVVTLKAGENLTQVFGRIHGGAVASLADAAIGAAHRSFLKPGESQATIELKVNFLKAVQPGDLVAEARVIHKGNKISFGQVHIKNSEGDLVAFGVATYMIL